MGCEIKPGQECDFHLERDDAPKWLCLSQRLPVRVCLLCEWGIMSAMYFIQNAFLPSRNYAVLSRLCISSKRANFLNTQSDFQLEIVHLEAAITPLNKTRDKALRNMPIVPFVVFTALLMKIKIFCDITPYLLVTNSRRFSPLFGLIWRYRQQIPPKRR